MDPQFRRCEDKMSFDNKVDAENTSTVAEYQHGSKLKVYKCRECDLWHLASDHGDKYDH
jgi:hypothetical protein